MPEILLQLDQCDAEAVRQIQADRCGRPIPLDDAIELLGSLAELRDVYAGKASRPDESGLLFRAVEIGGVTLFSPTVAARIALQAFDRFHLPADWTEHAQEFTSLGAAWILAHGRDPEALAAFREETAPAIIEAWAASITCTSHEISQVVADLAGFGYPPIETGTPSKKALARPARRNSSSVWPKLSRALRRATGYARFLKAMCIGCAKRLQAALAKPKQRPTPRSSARTTPASTPANAGNGSPRN